MEDVFGIVANVESDHILRTGAKVWILGMNGDAENVKVRGLAKSGRPVTKYIALKRLTTFRAAWVPEKTREDIWLRFQWTEKLKAEEFAAAWNQRWSNIRYYHRDGTLLKDGKPSSAAFQAR